MSVDQDSVRAPRPLTVSELNTRVRDLLEDGFPPVWVVGEVSRPSFPPSGHLYFTLKDRDARLDVVVWRSQVQRLRFPVQEGQEVVLRGQVTVFPPTGRYQLVAQRLELSGEGALRAAFLELKRVLEGEGLLDPDRRRPLPFLPRAVGLLTSPIGAARHDVCQTILTRFPSMRIVFCPTRVQGEGSAVEVVEGLRRLGVRDDLDVIIVARGGGSLEDLWTFNEERVVRAIAACPLPVICGVGHEIDVTLADLVADRRALTPTNAGELAVPVLEELETALADLLQRGGASVRRSLRADRIALDQLGRRAGLRWFARRLAETRQLLDGHDARARRAVVRRQEGAASVLARLESRLSLRSPLAWVRERRVAVHGLGARLTPGMRSRVGRSRLSVEPLGRALTSLNPVAVLGRGFSITRVERDGRLGILRDGSGLPAGARLRTTLGAGPELLSTVDGEAPRELPDPHDEGAPAGGRRG